MRTSLLTGVWGPGTAVPPHEISRQRTVELLGRACGLDADRRAWVQRLCERSGIDRRFTVVREFSHEIGAASQAPPWEARGSDDGLLGGLVGRMERYAKQAVPLALAAARSSLGKAGVSSGDVTHLVWVTCTGFANPGPDLDLAEQLGLGAHVHRLQIGFMGCQAAVQGLRLGDAICRSDSQAVVLLVCAELCTLHFDDTRVDREALVVASLFGDGAASVLMSRRSLAYRSSFQLLRFASRRVPAGAGLLSWSLGEPVFRMGLRPELPQAIEEQLADFASSLQPRILSRDRTSWAIHPGGRAVLDAAQRALDLDAGHMEPSRSVLRQFGNMSSPTLLFVLERMPEQAPAGVALAFGPGLSLEGFSWGRA